MSWPSTSRPRPRVAATHKNLDPKITYLTLKSYHGQRELLETTPHHPFITSKGWNVYSEALPFAGATRSVCLSAVTRRNRTAYEPYCRQIPHG